MTKRQEELLKIIITDYIKTAKPIGSDHLAHKFKLKLSSATIRNEMANLVKEEYIYQPHTSSGRVPTIKGFKYYIENLLTKSDLSLIEKNILKNLKTKYIKSNNEYDILIKQVAKEVSAICNELSVFAFNNRSFYYTGLSHLFNQPEFQEHDSVCNVSQIVDHLDKIMVEILDSIGEETQIMIGDDNLFSDSCGAIFTRCRFEKNSSAGLIGILGPIRMDYDRNLALINYTRELFDN